VTAGLLVAVEDEPGRRLVELVEHRQDRAARVAEHRVHLVIVHEHLVQDLGAGLALEAGLFRGGGGGCGLGGGLGLRGAHDNS
jgi:hypothetical protein